MLTLKVVEQLLALLLAHPLSLQYLLRPPQRLHLITLGRLLFTILCLHFFQLPNRNDWCPCLWRIHSFRCLYFVEDCLNVFLTLFSSEVWHVDTCAVALEKLRCDPVRGEAEHGFFFSLDYSFEVVVGELGWVALLSGRHYEAPHVFMLKSLVPLHLRHYLTHRGKISVDYSKFLRAA